MISIISTQPVGKNYPNIGVTESATGSEDIIFYCNVESVSISGATLTARYSVYVGTVRGSDLLSASGAYDSSKDLMTQAEDAIKNNYS